MSNKYKEMMKELRGLVNFDYDLRKELHPRQKGKIQKYYDELQEAKGQPVRVYRPRNKKKLRAVQDAAGMELNGFKIALIPDTDPNNRIKVDYKNGEVVFKSRHSEKRFIEFDQANLLNDTESEIARVMDLMRGDRTSIACGKFEYGSGRYFAIPAEVKDKCLQLINQYSNKEANNFFQNWLHGLYDIKIKNQEQLEDAQRFAQIYKATPRKKRKALKMKAAKNDSKKNRNR